MIVDNGSRRHLQIGGVFDGTCGVSRGVIAFIPNRFDKKPEQARAALLDDEPVRLSGIRSTADGRAYVARFEVIE
jgi:hypothetical protein